MCSNFSNHEHLSSAGDQLLNIPNLPGSSLEFVKRNSIAIICWIFSKVTCMQTVWIFWKMFRFHHLSHLNVGYLFYYRRILKSEIIREWRVWKLKTKSHSSITGPTTFFSRIINAQVRNLSLNIFKFSDEKGYDIKTFNCCGINLSTMYSDCLQFYSGRDLSTFIII